MFHVVRYIVQKSQLRDEECRCEEEINERNNFVFL